LASDFQTVFLIEYKPVLDESARSMGVQVDSASPLTVQSSSSAAHIMDMSRKEHGYGIEA